MKILPGIILCLSVLLGGCISQGAASKAGTSSWGGQVQWPSAAKFAKAARSSAVDPQTWVPVLAAGVLIAADVDDQWSEDLADDQPLFGSDAEDVSDDLRDLSTAAYVISALIVPSDSLADKSKGFAVGLGTMALDGIVNQGIKDLTGRRRPDDSNNNSFPSGHASKAASRTHLAINNIRQIDMPGWAKSTSIWGLHGVAVGTGLARVEARKHHLSDVLVGYALGNYIASFMNKAFSLQSVEGLEVGFQAVGNGGAFTISIPLR